MRAPESTLEELRQSMTTPWTCFRMRNSYPMPSVPMAGIWAWRRELVATRVVSKMLNSQVRNGSCSLVGQWLAPAASLLTSSS